MNETKKAIREAKAFLEKFAAAKTPAAAKTHDGVLRMARVIAGVEHRRSGKDTGADQCSARRDA
jgi:hypothetical protein